MGIPYPSLNMGVDITYGVTGDFNLNLKRANLPEDVTVDSTIDDRTGGLDKQRVDNYDPGFVPGIVGFTAHTNLMAGCNHPVRVKGRFKNKATIRVVIGDIDYTHESTTEFTDVRPADANVDTVFFVGSHISQSLRLGEIDWGFIEYGPILKGTIGYTGGGLGSAELKYNERNFPRFLSDGVREIHSCTEFGKRGCVHGQVRKVKEFHLDLGAKISIPVPIFDDIDVIDETWRVARNYVRGILLDFVQSLTWNEELKYQRVCDHMYYKVPVAVWADQAHTVPINGAHVSVNGGVQADENVLKYTEGTTGEHPDLARGRVNLYLPFKDGKYSLHAETMEFMEGDQEQPVNMIRGANDRTNIVLASTEMVTFRAEKEWDIDFENKDKPASIDVMLQSLHYDQGYWQWQGVQIKTLNAANGWACDFDAVPISEYDRQGKKKIKYRIRELKPDENENQAPNVDPVRHRQKFCARD